MIGFVELKHTAHPGEPGLLVRDRDLLRQLVLPVVLVGGQHVELGGVRLHDEFVVQRPISVRLTSVVDGVSASVRRALEPNCRV